MQRGGWGLKMRSFLFFVFRKYSQGVRKKTETLQHAATMYTYVYVYMYTYATHCHLGTWWWNTFSAAHCNTLQHTSTSVHGGGTRSLQHTAAHAAHCNTLQHCSTRQHTATRNSTLQHSATSCNTLQYTATSVHGGGTSSGYACRTRCGNDVPKYAPDIISH